MDEPALDREQYGIVTSIRLARAIRVSERRGYGTRNNRLAFAVVAAANASSVVPRTSARQAAVCCTCAGSLRLILRTGSGDKYGLSVSTRIRSSGIEAATARRSADFLYVTIPAKLMYSPI